MGWSRAESSGRWGCNYGILRNCLAKGLLSPQHPPAGTHGHWVVKRHPNLPGPWYSPVGVNDPFTRWPCRDLTVTGARHYPETGGR